MLTSQELSVIGAPFAGQMQSIHLLLADGQPIEIGEGKVARVFLGIRSGTTLQGVQIGDLVAVKFLKQDKSATVTSNSVYRFCREVIRTADARRLGLTASVVGLVAYGRAQVLPSAGSNDLRILEEAFGYAFDSDAQSHGTSLRVTSTHWTCA